MLLDRLQTGLARCGADRCLLRAAHAARAGAHWWVVHRRHTCGHLAGAAWLWRRAAKGNAVGARRPCDHRHQLWRRLQLTTRWGENANACRGAVAAAASTRVARHCVAGWGRQAAGAARGGRKHWQRPWRVLHGGVDVLAAHHVACEKLLKHIGAGYNERFKLPCTEVRRSQSKRSVYWSKSALPTWAIHAWQQQQTNKMTALCQRFVAESV